MWGFVLTEIYKVCTDTELAEKKDIFEIELLRRLSQAQR